MSRSTISTFQLFEMFPDQETARVYLEGRLWPNGVRALIAAWASASRRARAATIAATSARRISPSALAPSSSGRMFRCISGFMRCTCVVTARKGISSMQLAKEIGVTQKTAWFVLGRLREACGDKVDKLQRHRRD